MGPDSNLHRTEMLSHKRTVAAGLEACLTRPHVTAGLEACRHGPAA